MGEPNGLIETVPPKPSNGDNAEVAEPGNAAEPLGSFPLDLNLCLDFD